MTRCAVSRSMESEGLDRFFENWTMNLIIGVIPPEESPPRAGFRVSGTRLERVFSCPEVALPELPNTRPLRDVTDETERNPKRSVYLRRARRRFQKLLVDTVIDQIEHEHQDPVPPVADMWRGVLYQTIRDAAAGDLAARRYWWTSDFIEVCRLACVKPERVRQIIVRRGWGDRPFDRDSFRWPTLTLKKRPSSAVAS